METEAAIIGINNRNLDTFETNLETTLQLCHLIPEEKIIVSESGIKTRADILKLEKAGIDASIAWFPADRQARKLVQGDDDPDRARDCDEQFEKDNKQCRRFRSPRIRALCYGRAVLRYGLCRAGKELPRLFDDPPDGEE